MKPIDYILISIACIIIIDIMYTAIVEKQSDLVKKQTFATANAFNDDCNNAINEMKINATKTHPTDQIVVSNLRNVDTICNRFLIYATKNQELLDNGNVSYWATDSIKRIQTNQIIYNPSLTDSTLF